MNAVAKLRQAGFLPALSPAGGLLIEPASRLTPEQRTYIRAHKVLLLEELRAELAPVLPEPLPPFDQDAFEERAAILEFEAGFSRDEAERRARALMRASPVEAEPVAPSPLLGARPEMVCCGDCVHSVLPPDTDPVYGWRLCAAGGFGGFARAVQQCGKWEARQVGKLIV